MARYRAGHAYARHGNCEAFNGRMRDELLDETLFFGIDHAREAVARRPHSCNTERPHSVLGYQAPAVFAAQFIAMGDQLRASEPLRGSPIARLAQPRQKSTADSGLSRMNIGGHSTDVVPSALRRALRLRTLDPSSLWSG